jgi:hypothetical protein
VRYLSTTTQAITPSQNTVSWSTLDSNVQGDLGISFKNRIINGAMTFDQRNNGASITFAGGVERKYTVDRWGFVYFQNSKFTGQQNLNSITPPAGFANYFGLQTAATFTVGTTEVFTLSQLIEGYNVADLNWGSANAKTVTLSFWVQSSLTGTFGGAIGNSNGTRGYPFSYTISSANTWEYKTITVTGDTSGTWLNTNGSGIRIDFSLATGATYSGTAGAWVGAERYSATGAVTFGSATNQTFYLTGVQFEIGTQATTFTTAGGSYGAELALCYRYCFVLRTDASGYTQYGRFPPSWNVSTTNANFDLFLPTTMRNTAYSVTYNNKQYEMYFISGGGATGQGGTTMTLNTDANGLNWVNINLTATSPGTWNANQISGFRFTNVTDGALIISTEL